MKRIADANADKTDKKSATIRVARRAFVAFAFYQRSKKNLNADETDRCANADKTDKKSATISVARRASVVFAF
jgi:hypothetical protein